MTTSPTPERTLETEPGAFCLQLSHDGQHVVTAALSTDGWETVFRRYALATGELCEVVFPLDVYTNVRTAGGAGTLLAERREGDGVDVIDARRGIVLGRSLRPDLEGDLCPLGTHEARVSNGPRPRVVCRDLQGNTRWTYESAAGARLADPLWGGLLYVIARLVDSAGHHVLVLDAQTGAFHTTILVGAAPLDRVVASPDGLRAITVDATDERVVRCLDLIRGEHLDRPELTASRAVSLAFSPAGELLVTLDDRGELTVWADDARRIVRRVSAAGLAGKRASVGFSSDGLRLAATSAEASVLHVWNVASLLAGEA
jgi:hypothetical protein